MTQIGWIYTDKSSGHLFNPDGKNNSLSVMILPTQPLKVISSTSFSPSIRQFLLSTSQAKKQCLQCRLIINSGVWHYHSNGCKVVPTFQSLCALAGKKAEHSFFP
jgi:hypothetical protein